MIDYKSIDFIKNHAIDLIEFYKPNVKDEEFGGYYCAYSDDGSVYNKEIKNLISTTRFILNFCFGMFLDKSKDYKEYIRHGLEFLEIIHRDEKNDGYHENVIKNKPIIGNKFTYGQAFCLCAVSNAYMAGVKEALPLIERIYKFFEEKLWEKKHGLYVDECTNNFDKVCTYRGQNSNMHITEAMIAAYEATGDEKYLDKAYGLAQMITIELAEKSYGMIWEHYDKNWEIDWDYNKSTSMDLSRPYYGFLPGHFTEWAKLLLIIERYKPAEWILKVAEKLYSYAIENAWDREKGGIAYSFDMKGQILDSDRYYWVLAETIAASAILALRTGKEKYWENYINFWNYSYNYLFDRRYGGWHRVLNIDRTVLSNKKSPPGKTDYHTIGACYEIFRSMKYYDENKKDYY